MTNRDMSDPGDGGAAAIVAGLLVVVAVMLAIFFYVGIDGAHVQAGIAAVLPHVDDFVAGHSVASYAELMEVLAGA